MADDARTHSRRKIFLAIVAGSALLCLIIATILLRVFWCSLSSNIVFAELRGIYWAVNQYTSDYPDTYNTHGRELILPKTLDFLEKEWYGEYFLKNFRKEEINTWPSWLRWVVSKAADPEKPHFIDLRRVEYIWLGEYDDNFYIHHDTFLDDGNMYHPPFARFYGEFSYHQPGDGDGSWKGLPLEQTIMLVYNDEKYCGRAFVYLLNDQGLLLSREEVDERIVLQNAFLRMTLDESAIPHLLKGLDHANSGYRFRCAEALAKLGRPEGREFLDRHFRSDDPFLKVRAADALARVGDREALEYLHEATEKSPDEDIRSFAREVLKEIS